MPKREPNHHGILIVDKPGRTTTGLDVADNAITNGQSAEQDLPTSHDIVQMARRWCQQRRIGHTGTLDPMASGVLVLCLGKTTRLVEYYQNHSKQYYAEVCLGAATDTYDGVGRVTDRSPIPEFDIEEIEAVLAGFRGEILQTPPLFSAIKQGGESLHRKARRGETVAIEPRKVTFYRLDLVNFAPPDRLSLRILCSAGTYIRSLAHDLGLALQTHAYLDVLRREAAGSFTEEQAHTPEEINTALDDGTFSQLILPSGFGLSMPTVDLDADEIRRFGFGQVVLLSPEKFHGLASGTKIDPDIAVSAKDLLTGDFVGIIRQIPNAQIQSDETNDNTRKDNTRSDSNGATNERAIEQPNGVTETTETTITAWKAEKWFANS